jgi:outer membrane protein OmpA-like peptidoglycan-associated protein
MLMRAARRRRLRRIRGRFVFAAMFLVPFCAGLALLQLDDSADDLLSPPTAGPGIQSIVALRDGRTLVAPEGTVGRDIVEWLDSRQAGRQYFELGGDQFEGDTSEPTAESVARLDRLATMLQANRDVSVRIIGHAAPTVAAAAVRDFAERRAQRVRSELIARGVTPRRLVADGEGDSGLAKSGAAPSARVRDGRVAIFLTRGGPPEPRPTV